MNNLENATKRFIEQSEWLGNSETEVAEMQLILLAREIDGSPATASLHSQYGLTYRFLMSLRPQTEQVNDVDPLDQILKREMSV